MTTNTYVNAETWDVSRDYNTVEAWEIGDGEFQYVVQDPTNFIMVQFNDDAEGAYEFCRKITNRLYDGVCEFCKENMNPHYVCVLAVPREHLL